MQFEKGGCGLLWQANMSKEESVVGWKCGKKEGISPGKRKWTLEKKLRIIFKFIFLYVSFLLFAALKDSSLQLDTGTPKRREGDLPQGPRGWGLGLREDLNGKKPFLHVYKSVLYLDQWTHACACIRMVENDQKHLKISKKVPIISCTREAHIRLTKKNE